MFEGFIERRVDKRLNEILGESVRDGVDKYVKDLLKSALVVDEPQEIITKPGTSYVLLSYSPRTPVTMGGFVDLRGLGGEDKFVIKCEVRLSKDQKWAKYFEHTFNGVIDEPIFSVQEMVVVGGIKITLTHESGIGKKITHLWYKRK